MTVHFHSPSQFFQFLKNNGLTRKYGLHRIAVFGSFARNEPYKDIDLLIEDDLDWRELIKFREEFQNLTGQKLDIMLKKFAEPLILRHAQNDLRYESEA
jgi:predicted nucleotidyltransferase